MVAPYCISIIDICILSAIIIIRYTIIGCLGRGFSTSQQLSEVVVHTRHSKIWLALKGLAQIVDTVSVFAGELDDGEDEVVWFVE